MIKYINQVYIKFNWIYQCKTNIHYVSISIYLASNDSMSSSLFRLESLNLVGCYFGLKFNFIGLCLIQQIGLSSTLPLNSFGRYYRNGREFSSEIKVVLLEIGLSE